VSTVTEHRKRASRAAADGQHAPDSERQDNPEQPAAEGGEPTYKYISEWGRDCTCGVCGHTFGQLNYFLGSKAMGAVSRAQSRDSVLGVPSHCRRDLVALRIVGRRPSVPTAKQRAGRKTRSFVSLRHTSATNCPSGSRSRSSRTRQSSFLTQWRTSATQCWRTSELRAN
jgi:hypothetical protein